MTLLPGRARSGSLRAFILHIHPAKIDSETLRFSLTFGLGGMSAMLVVILGISGILQSISYVPAIGGAYSSIVAMQQDGNFSGWIRNIHYWSGNLLIISASLHLLRVFFTGAFSASRKWNWVVGLGLLSLLFAANFTGYLLPWDQLSYWAVTIFLNMIGYIPVIGSGLAQLLRGGDEIGNSTLSTFHAIHTGFLPFSLAIVMLFHFWLIRKAGGVVRKSKTSASSSEMVSVIPHLIVRETTVALCLVAFVLLFAALFDAPLAEHANPGMSPNPAKAAWFLMGLQELLMHLHPVYAICIFPALGLFCLLALPWIDNSSLPQGNWFGGKKGRKLSLKVFGGSVFMTFVLLVVDEKIKAAGEAVATDAVTRGFIPLCITIVLFMTGYYLLTRQCKYSRAEAIMAGFVSAITVMIFLTVTGVFFRGPGMMLFFPLV